MNNNNNNKNISNENNSNNENNKKQCINILFREFFFNYFCVISYFKFILIDQVHSDECKIGKNSALRCICMRMIINKDKTITQQ